MTDNYMQSNTGKLTRRYRVYGIVQGVGFRPVTARHAETAGVKGMVSNKGSFVEITAQGGVAQLERFEELIRTEPPKRAVILKTDVKNITGSPEYESFEIALSEKKSGEIFVSPDIAVCDECAAELFDRENRRYLHPFINCTCCGPRLTILESLPYDRERTSMKEFDMCPECSAEYHDPATRRYDAQPVCCNDCGPEVYTIEDGAESLHGLSAITRARQVIAGGGIVAIKGIGGFHLCCDGTNDEAVRLLRERKTRPFKPFALMMKNMDTVARECDIGVDHKEILTGHQKPILLLHKRKDGKTAPAVAPGNPKIGVMLPYAPVHLLLFDLPDDGVQNMPDVLVMTSGNVSGAPICRDDEEAKAELGNLCDIILSHNRKIRVRADDSVMDMYGGKPYMIRRSRGYAPLPFMISADPESRKHRNVLAIGGELKNTFCITKDGLFYPSAYIGDLADLRTVKALKETVDRFATLLETKPEVVVCDMHPGYNSVAVAGEYGLPVMKIQHHYAHVLSCMAENDHTGSVIGVSFDGTGYGTDGTIWGGELLICDVHSFERFAHIAPFNQPGGDASSREGWRIACAMIYELAKDRDTAATYIEKLGLCTPGEAKMLFAMADRGINTVRSTSAGRLFDAVSALLGIKKTSTFEGEASTALQFAAEEYLEDQWAPAKPNLENLENPAPLQLPTNLLFEYILSERLKGADTGYLAYLFHRKLADMVAEACDSARTKSGLDTVALSGGCFQNTLLLGMTDKLLTERGFKVLKHSMIPPNDGGIAIGQALYGVMNCPVSKVI